MAQRIDSVAALEAVLDEALASCESLEAPPGLVSAVHYAVKPGGARIRPQLCLAVAGACGASSLALPLAAGAALELMHCASLVHDDMPAFDNADARRGKPSVHKAYGEPLALLAGDALIVLAYDILAKYGSREPQRLAPMVRRLSAAIGLPGGLCAGQAWESEPDPDLDAYHRAKTGALFACATSLGAEAAGYSEPDCWAAFGHGLGAAYQIADDIRDVVSKASEIGKPAGQDRALGRPNSALLHGTPKAVQMLVEQVSRTLDDIPSCPGRSALVTQVRAQTRKFLPARVWALAA